MKGVEDALAFRDPDLELARQELRSAETKRPILVHVGDKVHDDVAPGYPARGRKALNQPTVECLLHSPAARTRRDLQHHYVFCARNFQARILYNHLGLFVYVHDLITIVAQIEGGMVFGLTA